MLKFNKINNIFKIILKMFDFINFFFLKKFMLSLFLGRTIISSTKDLEKKLRKKLI